MSAAASLTDAQLDAAIKAWFTDVQGDSTEMRARMRRAILAAQPHYTDTGESHTMNDNTKAEEHPAAKRMREEFEAKYGHASALMLAAIHWFNVRNEWNDAWNRDREKPITEDDVEAAEKAMLAHAAQPATKAAPQGVASERMGAAVTDAGSEREQIEEEKRIREVLPTLLEKDRSYGWDEGVAGSANIVCFNGEDLAGVCRIDYEPRRQYIISANPKAMGAVLIELDRLRAALAASATPEVEPFGYWHEGATEEESDFFLHREMGDVRCEKCTVLYTRPAASAGDALTDEQIGSRIEGEHAVLLGLLTDCAAVLRTIEPGDSDEAEKLASLLSAIDHAQAPSRHQGELL